MGIGTLGEPLRTRKNDTMAFLIVNEAFPLSRDLEILLDDLSDDSQIEDREGLPGGAKIDTDW